MRFDGPPASCYHKGEMGVKLTELLVVYQLWEFG
jgi:hypothetical protein